MKILHYFLGFPPFRTGGSIKYAVDLMLSQIKTGDNVSALFPGMINPLCPSVRIRKKKDVKRIHTYEIINPLPIPLDEGIRNIDKYTRSCNKNIYKSFLSKTNPEIIHFHTVMGLHKEFVEAANESNIKTVFTTHDYFGLCPKAYFFKNNTICDGNTENCFECNTTALSMKKIYALQSPLYRGIKNTHIIRMLRQKHRSHFFNNTTIIRKMYKDVNYCTDNKKKYDILRRYYIQIFNNFNIVHFNSNISKSVFSRFLLPAKSTVINLTHNDIGNKKIIKDFSNSKLRIAFLSQPRPLKGFDILIKALDDLYLSGVKNFELSIYAKSPIQRDYLTEYPQYIYSELEDMFFHIDVIVVPSTWYETFGFTVQEALCHGVPVIVSDNVGAKDIVEDKFGIISNKIKDSIYEVISNREILKEINENIFYNFEVKTMTEHEKEIKKMYRSI